MAYITSEARQELLDTVAEATDELVVAIAALGDAYEALDEQSADTLEEELFRPAQAAYGRAKRTYTDFAARHGHDTRAFDPTMRGLPSTGVKGFLEAAVDHVEQAEAILIELQDSMSPVEVGDPELRAGLAEVRELLGGERAPGHEFTRTLGRSAGSGPSGQIGSDCASGVPRTSIASVSLLIRANASSPRS